MMDYDDDDDDDDNDDGDDIDLGLQNENYPHHRLNNHNHHHQLHHHHHHEDEKSEEKNFPNGHILSKSNNDQDRLADDMEKIASNLVQVKENSPVGTIVALIKVKGQDKDDTFLADCTLLPSSSSSSSSSSLPSLSSSFRLSRHVVNEFLLRTGKVFDRELEPSIRLKIRCQRSLLTSSLSSPPSSSPSSFSSSSSSLALASHAPDRYQAKKKSKHHSYDKEERRKSRESVRGRIDVGAKHVINTESKSELAKRRSADHKRNQRRNLNHVRDRDPRDEYLSREFFKGSDVTSKIHPGHKSPLPFAPSRVEKYHQRSRGSEPMEVTNPRFKYTNLEEKEVAGEKSHHPTLSSSSSSAMFETSHEHALQQSRLRKERRKLSPHDQQIKRNKKSAINNDDDDNMNNNNGDYAEVTVEVIIGDVNDNPPMTSSDTYEVDVDENLQPEVKIFKMAAWDPDAGNNGLMSYSIEMQSPGVKDGMTSWKRDHILRIDKETGEISSLVSFDYEKQQFYRALVYIFDHGHPSLTSSVYFRVKVQDQNDNPPHFGKSVFYMSVSENDYSSFHGDVTTPVGHVMATDEDTLPEHTRILYSILDSQTANVTTRNKQNESSHSTSSTKYFGEPSFWFSIDENTGVVRTKRPLDREFQPSFHFRVSARHPTMPGHVSTAQVVVYVNDINDNQPVIIRPKPGEIIQGSCPLNSRNKLVRLEAIDPDEGKNGQSGVRFELLAVTPLTHVDLTGTELNGLMDYKKLFSLDRISGVMSILTSVGDETLSRLPEQLCCTYKIKIRVSDRGDEPFHGDQRLTSEMLFYVTFDNQSDAVYRSSLLIENQSSDDASKTHLHGNETLSTKYDFFSGQGMVMVTCLGVLGVVLMTVLAMIAACLVVLVQRKRRHKAKMRTARETHMKKSSETEEKTSKDTTDKHRCESRRSGDSIKMQMSVVGDVRQRSNCDFLCRNFICTRSTCLSPQYFTNDDKVEITSGRLSDKLSSRGCYDCDKQPTSSPINRNRKFCDARPKLVENVEQVQVELEDIDCMGHDMSHSGNSDDHLLLDNRASEIENCDCHLHVVSSGRKCSLIAMPRVEAQQRNSYAESAGVSCYYSNASSCGSRNSNSRSSSVLSDAITWGQKTTATTTTSDLGNSSCNNNNNKVNLVEMSRDEFDFGACAPDDQGRRASDTRPPNPNYLISPTTPKVTRQTSPCVRSFRGKKDIHLSPLDLQHRHHHHHHQHHQHKRHPFHHHYHHPNHHHHHHHQGHTNSCNDDDRHMQLERTSPSPNNNNDDNNISQSPVTSLPICAQL